MVRPRPPLARFCREPRVTRSTRIHSIASGCPPLPSPHRPATHFCRPFFWVAAGGVSVILVRPKEIACGELREALEQYDRDPKATGQLCVVVCPQLGVAPRDRRELLPVEAQRELEADEAAAFAVALDPRRHRRHFDRYRASGTGRRRPARAESATSRALGR